MSIKDIEDSDQSFGAECEQAKVLVSGEEKLERCWWFQRLEIGKFADFTTWMLKTKPLAEINIKKVDCLIIFESDAAVSLDRWPFDKTGIVLENIIIKLLEVFDALSVPNLCWINRGLIIEI